MFIKLVDECEKKSSTDESNEHSIDTIKADHQIEMKEETKNLVNNMERKIGDIFEYDNKKIKVVGLTIMDNQCTGCYFLNNEICHTNKIVGECSWRRRTDKTGVIFKLVDMCENKEKRNVELTLNKAKEWYKKGGELQEVALQAFSEEELKDNRSHSWEEYTNKKHNIGFCTNLYGNIDEINCNYKAVFPTLEYTNASVALAQLLKLREEWIEDWSPDWYSHNNKFIIANCSNTLTIEADSYTSFVMSFPSKAMAEEFLNDFRDLLVIAKPLL